MERANKRLESKYTELTRRKLANPTVENSQSTKDSVKKEDLIENISNQMSKETTEYHVLKRELKIRTLNADVAKQETASLEAERQRLRLLVKKRVPGNEKTKSVDKSKSLMIKKLYEVEEENRILKESLCKRENEIRILKREKVEWNHEEKILELENKIVSLELEVERVNESKRTTEEKFEDLRLINVDLDYQLYASKFEIKEAFRKLSVLEMELEDKSQQYEELETTCLELQLQLASVSCKNEVSEDLHSISGYEGVKELINNKKLREHSSILPTIKEILTTKETKDLHYNTCNNLCRLKNVAPQALTIVPRMKRSKGTELLWKLLIRRKKRGNMKKLHRFATYHI
ncbi:unnamed protein product [Lactuca saligna]|uniref:Uncharacterized protein n=1 Tax=Lactuca saligna TaxID=75948 RepID=A0AA35XYP8_LACSI|nr:unnamed protein product [Lactuca saligna]